MTPLAYGRMFQPQSIEGDFLLLLVTVPLVGWLGMHAWNKLSKGGLCWPQVEHWPYAVGVSAAAQLLIVFIYWSATGHSLFYGIHGPL